MKQIVIDDGIHRELKVLAATTGETITEHVARAVRPYLRKCKRNAEIEDVNK